MPFPDYDHHDALGLAELVRRGEVTAVDLLDEAIARANRVNPAINAVICRLDDRARTRARGIVAGSPEAAGPFAGVPFLVKDFGPFLAGAPMTMGSRSLREFVPNRDAELFARSTAAGLNIFGKTNVPEFAHISYTEPELFGPCRNPWNTGYTPGGSSGGAAAAVAAGIVPMAHGNDGGGSIRIPASCTGLFGLKPSRGRQPLGPDGVDLAGALAVDHVLSRSVRDSAAMLDVTHDRDPGASFVAPSPVGAFLAACGRDPEPLRVAMIPGAMLGKEVHPEARAAQERTAKLLAGLGHRVEEVALPLDYDEVRRAYTLLFVTNVAQAVGQAEQLVGRRVGRDEIEVLPWFCHSHLHSLRADDLAWALAAEGRLARAIGGFMTSWDLLLTPTLAAPPLAIGERKLKPIEVQVLDLASRLRTGLLFDALVKQLSREAYDWAAFTPLFNMTGQPAMSVPLHWTADGLPIGSQIVGRYGDEATLFAVAGQLERAQPWFDRRPPSP